MQASSLQSSERSSHRFAVVLAGGSGTRLWPLSRTTKPKQLLALNGDESLLQQTVRRVLPLVPAERIYIVTHQDHRFEVAGQLLAIDARLPSNILSEPVARNTLPAITWAASHIVALDPDAAIGVFSSDHAVAEQAAFESAWLAAESATAVADVVLFGMVPTEPATGYGYIQAGAALSGHGEGAAVYAVTQFKEKPNLERAREFLRQGGYYWNGGMFVFRAASLLRLVEQLVPQMAAAIPQLRTAAGQGLEREMYAALPELSIDYGILERAERVAVVPVQMGWNDLGSWDAIYQQHDKDRDGNVVLGRVITAASQNNLLWSDRGLLAVLGLDDVVVVQTGDATLVCRRELAADLKDLVAQVKRADPRLTETHLTVSRPWGSYTVLEDGAHFKVKRIVVNPGEKLSLQMHFHRAEHWVVVAGTAKIVNGDKEIYLEETQSTYIPKTHRHRLENPGRIPLHIIEIQTGAYLEEDDIVRFGDVYGRVSQA